MISWRILSLVIFEYPFIVPEFFFSFSFFFFLFFYIIWEPLLNTYMYLIWHLPGSALLTGEDTTSRRIYTYEVHLNVARLAIIIPEMDLYSILETNHNIVT